ncbi:Hypothetical predicted protein, partial [Pelobates cultripes]
MAAGNATQMANTKPAPTPLIAPPQSLEAILNRFWDTIMRRQQAARPMTLAPLTKGERHRGWR